MVKIIIDLNFATFCKFFVLPTQMLAESQGNSGFSSTVVKLQSVVRDGHLLDWWEGVGFVGNLSN